MVQIGTPLSELGPFQLLDNDPSIIKGLNDVGAKVSAAPGNCMASLFNACSGGISAVGPVAELAPVAPAYQAKQSLG
jgi:hypothetical protein